ncbi:MAG: flavodoxin-dependent (E)-4-hydroxy-3-methylbut-2-enyl-diphosphate synthase [Rickettsiales bacterium]|jgi:(E)-4-hydroxy-3-methylbut-2-enyl-diphosphate synthase|nr:flavodoxin-dependent (E)-4-hydroxy-3-methylbut-2-enyl-diphosphate synthase [Rickettsiales bacterium]
MSDIDDLIQKIDIEESAKIARHKTYKVKVGNSYIGGDAPILIQSMTNTDTADAIGTAKQVIELYNAGSEVVRITVNNEQAAKSVAEIKNIILKEGYDIPLVGCFHYNGHSLLAEYPDCAEALDKYRINPGNVGFGQKRDKQYEQMVNIALDRNKPIRIGVNWGSLDQALLAELMDDNNKKSSPKTATEVLYDALVLSCLISAKKAENLGMSKDKIILSCKTSRIPDLVTVYQALAKHSDYALHLGLTEAGMGMKGTVATSSALAILLSQGIGDTIRASITPNPGGSRTEEVKLCKSLLQSLNFRQFAPEVSACPGCGRTTSSYFQTLSQDIDKFIQDNMSDWKTMYPGVESLKIAVMGCIVNGPGESKHADIGISLPGTGEEKIAPVFIDGKKSHTLRGDTITQDFTRILTEYIEKRFG